MDYKELQERIKTLDISYVETMTPDTLAKLTDKFKEPLVKALLAKKPSNKGQRKLIKIIKGAYKSWMEDDNPLVLDVTYPEYLEDLQFEIECGRVWTKSGWAVEEKLRLEVFPPTTLIQTLSKSMSESKKNTETKVDSKQLEDARQRIKELQEKNDTLETENADLKAKLAEALTIPETITAKQRVRMELARQFMEKAGINDNVLEVYGNKEKAATVMNILLHDVTPRTCAVYFSDHTLSHSYHKKALDELNPLLKDLQTDIQL